LFPGKFEHYSRDGIKEAVELNGGRIVSSISAKTDFVIAGMDMGPAKLKKAESLGISIISEDEFQQMISL
jgi:DNA ligase (NAD+)